MAFGEVDRPCEIAGEFVPICSSDRALRLEGVDERSTVTRMAWVKI